MDIYGLYSYGHTWTSSTIQNNRTSMVYGYSHGSPEIVKQQAEKKKKQKKKKESNIFFDFLDDIGDAIVETGKKAVDTVVDVGKYVGEKVAEYAPTVGTFIVENAPVLSNIKSGADFLFGFDVLTRERLSSTDRTLAFFGTFTGGGVKNLAESGFKNGSKFLNNLTPTVTRNVNKGTVRTEKQTLYHYTSEEGLKGITSSNKLNPSLKANNPKDARFGDGQYLTDIAPGSKTSGQLSRQFFGIPFLTKRVSHYIEIDVSGLNVVKGRDGVYLVPNNNPLDLSGRIVRTGKN